MIFAVIASIIFAVNKTNNTKNDNSLKVLDILEVDYLNSVAKRDRISFEEAKKNNDNLKEKHKDKEIIYKKISRVQSIKETSIETNIEVDVSVLYDRKAKEYTEFLGVGKPKINIISSNKELKWDGGEENIDFKGDNIRISFTGCASLKNEKNLSDIVTQDLDINLKYID